MKLFYPLQSFVSHKVALLENYILRCLEGKMSRVVDVYKYADMCSLLETFSKSQNCAWESPFIFKL